jgi:hypothetical protein
VNVRIADDVVSRDLAGEAVILNLATGTYFGLDAVGTRIWHLIAEHGSTERIVEIVVAEYDVDEGRLRGDLEALLGQLRDKGLVSVDATR